MIGMMTSNVRMEVGKIGEKKRENIKKIRTSIKRKIK